MPLTRSDFAQLSTLISEVKKQENAYISDLVGVLSFRDKEGKTLLSITQSCRKELDSLNQKFAEVIAKDDRKAATPFNTNFCTVYNRLLYALTLFNGFTSLPFAKDESGTKDAIATNIATNIAVICKQLKEIPNYVVVSDVLSTNSETWAKKICGSMYAERQAQLDREVREQQARLNREIEALQRTLHEKIGSEALRNIVSGMALSVPDPKDSKLKSYYDTLSLPIPGDFDLTYVHDIKSALIAIVERTEDKKALSDITDGVFRLTLLAIRLTKELKMLANVYECKTKDAATITMDEAGFVKFQNLMSEKTRILLNEAAALRLPEHSFFSEIIAAFRTEKGRFEDSVKSFDTATAGIANVLAEKQAAAEKLAAEQAAAEKAKIEAAVKEEAARRAAAEKLVAEQAEAKRVAAEQKATEERKRIDTINEEAKIYIKGLSTIEKQGFFSKDDERFYGVIGKFLGEHTKDDTGILNLLRSIYGNEKIARAYKVNTSRIQGDCEWLSKLLGPQYRLTASDHISLGEVKSILDIAKASNDSRVDIKKLRNLYDTVQVKLSTEWLVTLPSNKILEEENIARLRDIEAMLKSMEEEGDSAELRRLRSLYNMAQEQLHPSKEAKRVSRNTPPPPPVVLAVAEAAPASETHVEPPVLSRAEIQVNGYLELLGELDKKEALDGTDVAKLKEVYDFLCNGEIQNTIGERPLYEKLSNLYSRICEQFDKNPEAKKEEDTWSGDESKDASSLGPG